MECDVAAKSKPAVNLVLHGIRSQWDKPNPMSEKRTRAARTGPGARINNSTIQKKIKAKRIIV